MGKIEKSIENGLLSIMILSSLTLASFFGAIMMQNVSVAIFGVICGISCIVAMLKTILLMRRQKLQYEIDLIARMKDL